MREGEKGKDEPRQGAEEDYKPLQHVGEFSMTRDGAEPDLRRI